MLDQVTPAEFVSLTNRYYGSAEIGSVGKPWLRDLDGPAQIKGFNYAPRGTGYPTMVTVAQTWNPNLAYEFGKAFGERYERRRRYGCLGLGYRYAQIGVFRAQSRIAERGRVPCGSHNNQCR